MLDSEIITKLAEKLQKSIPKGILSLGEDVEKKIRQVLQAQLTHLDLISREEFDIQTQVLLQTREKLTLLERRVQELEKNQMAALKLTGQMSHGESHDCNE